ncbi:hypothetical protein [Pandoraea oxalativorans]|uniref:Surface presentation of antigen domain-containing protein n=1 Tax=Pandoraea oxalativorans TaxID=573737 RepID=A0A0E3Y9E7_9BURK|nr:hypothetical protein [Pandoraea oxalativorans]AKC69017.1 hypothetical protein MB84_05365 [Pandoraea oxalativorans]
MAQVSVAGTAEVSASPDETGRQQASDKTMAQRVDEALRRRASEHRNADDMPSAAPLWCLPMPMDRSPPLRLHDVSAGSASPGDGASSVRRAHATSVDGKEATDPSTRHGDARKALVELLRASRLLDGPTRSVTGQRTDASLVAGTPEVDTDRASVHRRDARTSTSGGVADIGEVGESSTASVDGRAMTVAGAALEATPEAGSRHDSRERSHRGEGGASAPGASTPQVVHGQTFAPPPGARRFAAPMPHRPMAPRAPVHPLPGDATHRPFPAGDGMRYAFGSWGKGHFVNVRVIQVDGRRGFMLGASDAVVQRRLTAALPGAASSSDEGASRRFGVRAIEAVEKLENTSDEDAGC